MKLNYLKLINIITIITAVSTSTDVLCTGTPFIDTALILAALPTVSINGVCALNQTLLITSSHSSITGVTSNAALVGGLPLLSFAPVTDKSILDQLPTDEARASVVQIDLIAAGIPIFDKSATTSPWVHPCLAYAGASASLNYGSYIASSIELWFGSGDYSSTTALTPARFPNLNEPYPASWARIVEAGVNKSDNLYFRGPESLATRSAAWSNQIATDIQSIGLSVFTQPLFWATNIGPLQAFDAPDILRSMYCMDYPSTEEVPQTNGSFSVFNVLAELDTPGEYYINRTSGFAYVWPPPQAKKKTSVSTRKQSDTTSPIAWASLLENLVVIEGAANVSISNLSLGITRGGALITNDAISIRVTNVTLANVGNMALNISNGNDNIFSYLTIAETGNGGAYMIGGDRISLTKSGNKIINSSFTNYNRHQICYTPAVALDGVGNELIGSEIFNAPHQAVWMQGNFHSLSNNYIHDVCQITEDSGAVYAGRDWTYQGNVISYNTFANINTLASGNGYNNVQAVYLDDLVSGFTIFANTFINVSRALHLGGGRSIIFQNNTIKNPSSNSMKTANHIDNRGMGWDKVACTPPNGILIQFLDRVPYTTNQVWKSSFPLLVNITNDTPCQAKYNYIADNILCGLENLSAFDVSPSVFAEWSSVILNNTITEKC